MAVGRMPMLRVGEWVHFEGEEHQVVALAGTSVRLHSRSGAAQVVLLTFLLAAADFELVDGPAMPAVEPFGLLDRLPEEVADRARWWQRHVVEVMTGLPPGAEARSRGPGSTRRPRFWRSASRPRRMS